MIEHELRDIAGFPGYFISSDGQVWSRRGRWAQSREKHPVAVSESNNGYLRVCLYDDFGRKRHMTVHRLVLEAFVGARPTGMEACHNNGIKADNRVGNLRWDTKQANAMDRRCHGTHLCGERIPFSKLTEAAVVMVRKLAREGVSYNTIAARIGSTPGTVRDAARGKSWAHVAEPVVPRKYERRKSA